jgi:hypothetical protein
MDGYIVGGIRVGGAREGEISKIIGGLDEIALLRKEHKVYCFKDSFERERVTLHTHHPLHS